MTTSWTLAMGRYDFARTALVYAPTPPSVQSHTRRSMPGLLAANMASNPELCRTSCELGGGTGRTRRRAVSNSSRAGVRGDLGAPEPAPNPTHGGGVNSG